MYELSHRRLDITDVAQYTIGEFIKELGKGIVITYLVNILLTYYRKSYCTEKKSIS